MHVIRCVFPQVCVWTHPLTHLLQRGEPPLECRTASELCCCSATSILPRPPWRTAAGTSTTTATWTSRSSASEPLASPAAAACCGRHGASSRRGRRRRGRALAGGAGGEWRGGARRERGRGRGCWTLPEARCCCLWMRTRCCWRVGTGGGTVGRGDGVGVAYAVAWTKS